VAWPLAALSSPCLDPRRLARSRLGRCCWAVGTKSHSKGASTLWAPFARIAATTPRLAPWDPGARRRRVSRCVDRWAALRGLAWGGPSCSRRAWASPASRQPWTDWYARADLFVAELPLRGLSPTVLLESDWPAASCLALYCRPARRRFSKNGATLLLPADAEATQLAAPSPGWMGDPQRRGCPGREARRVRERLRRADPGPVPGAAPAVFRRSWGREPRDELCTGSKGITGPAQAVVVSPRAARPLQETFYRGQPGAPCPAPPPLYAVMNAALVVWPRAAAGLWPGVSWPQRCWIGIGSSGLASWIPAQVAHRHLPAARRPDVGGGRISASHAVRVMAAGARHRPAADSSTSAGRCLLRAATLQRLKAALYPASVAALQAPCWW